jgi:hypothetical protein
LGDFGLEGKPNSKLPIPLWEAIIKFETKAASDKSKLPNSILQDQYKDAENNMLFNQIPNYPFHFGRL